MNNLTVSQFSNDSDDIAAGLQKHLIELSSKYLELLEKNKDLKNQCDYFQEIIKAYKDARDEETKYIYDSEELTMNLALMMDEIHVELIDKIDRIAEDYNIH